MLQQVDIEGWGEDEEGNPVVSHQSLIENVERVITYSTLHYNGIPEENSGFFYEVIVTKGMVEVNRFNENGDFELGGILPLSDYGVSMSNMFIEKDQ